MDDVTYAVAWMTPDRWATASRASSGTPANAAASSATRRPRSQRRSRAGAPAVRVDEVVAIGTKGALRGRLQTSDCQEVARATAPVRRRGTLTPRLRGPPSDSDCRVRTSGQLPDGKEGSGYQSRSFLFIAQFWRPLAPRLTVPHTCQADSSFPQAGEVACAPSQVGSGRHQIAGVFRIRSAPFCCCCVFSPW